MYLFGGIKEVGRWSHCHHSGRELNFKKEWATALKSGRKQLTEVCEEEGERKGVVVTERLLCALEATATFPFFIQCCSSCRGRCGGDK